MVLQNSSCSTIYNASTRGMKVCSNILPYPPIIENSRISVLTFFQSHQETSDRVRDHVHPRDNYLHSKEKRVATLFEVSHSDGHAAGYRVTDYGTREPLDAFACVLGQVGMLFWARTSLAYFFTVLQCIIHALDGMYADVPFVCDAAYWHTKYK